MPDALRFLTRTSGRTQLDWTDWLSYAYLVLGLFLMFGPVLWIVMSSFKTQSGLSDAVIAASVTFTRNSKQILEAFVHGSSLLRQLSIRELVAQKAPYRGELRAEGACSTCVRFTCGPRFGAVRPHVWKTHRNR